MWRDKTLLVVRKGEAFPDRCVKSNRPAHGCRVPQAAEQGSAASLAVHLWNPIAGALFSRFLTKTILFQVGLSVEWRRNRQRAFCLAGAIILISLGMVAYGGGLLGRGAPRLWLAPLGILSTLGGLLYGLNASTLLTTQRISNNYVWFKGVHPAFLAELPEWEGEVRADLVR